MFTEEKIQKLQEYYDQIDEAEKAFSNEYSKAMEGATERNHTITRNGKEVEVSEATLWYETNNLGGQSEAGVFLQTLYPAVFALAEKQNEISNEMHDFSVKQLGINPTKIKMIDIIRIAQGVNKMK